ncbi:MAG: SpoIIE family protein phosphatase [bacterium]|nr:SpoIIE family protein phosphatase [bacterium]
MAILHIHDGLKTDERIELQGAEPLFGRHPTCHIVLRETTVSRRHARIMRRPDGFYIIDVGSQHGTFVNNEQIEAATPLRDGDRIRISEVSMTFVDDETGDMLGKDETESSSTITSDLDASSIDWEGGDTNLRLKLRALLEIIHNLGASLDVTEIFPDILDSIFRIFPQTDRGYILLTDGLSDELHVRAMRTREDTTQNTVRISRTIAQRVMSDGRAMLSSDVVSDTRLTDSESVYGMKIRSVMCAPMLDSEKNPLGMIHVDTRDNRRRFSREDLEVLINVATLAGRAVEHARLHEREVVNERRRVDIETAEQVQRHFLPKGRPALEEFEISDFYTAAQGVGGDYYGYIQLPGGKLAITVGDVAGKGVAAALLMARLCSDVRYALVTHDTPAEAVNDLNEQISGLVIFGRFVTFALCVIDPAAKTATIVNAGHMPPILRNAETGEVREIGYESGGPPLGVCQYKYEQIEIPLEPGDALLLYTDGLNEAEDSAGRQFGYERIFETFGRPQDAHRTVEQLTKAIEEYTGDAEQVDDICMICIRRTEMTVDTPTEIE